MLSIEPCLCATEVCAEHHALHRTQENARAVCVTRQLCSQLALLKPRLAWQNSALYAHVSF